MTNSLVLGFFRINARYSVRGRRTQILSPSMRLALMTPHEREETFAVLVKKYGQSYAQSKLDMPIGVQYCSNTGRRINTSSGT